MSYRYVNTVVDDKILQEFKKTISEMELSFKLGLQAAIMEWSIRQK